MAKRSKPSNGDKSGTDRRYSACRDPATGRFIKGNPGGGRPRMPEELKADFRACAPEALDTILAILRDGDAPHRDRLRAAEIILDRGYGKPVQAVDLSAEGAESGLGVIIMPPVMEAGGDG